MEVEQYVSAAYTLCSIPNSLINSPSTMNSPALVSLGLLFDVCQMSGVPLPAWMKDNYGSWFG
jgi:hypothetical protein